MYDQMKNIRIDSKSSIRDVIETLPAIYDHVFKETRKLTRFESFVRTINYMLQAKQIDFYANDNNYSEVQSACLKLNTIGIKAQCFNTLNTAYIDNIDPRDILAFVVSHSGKIKQWSMPHMNSEKNESVSSQLQEKSTQL